MGPAPQLQMLDALVGEVEQRLEFGSPDPAGDLATTSEQLRRLLYVHLGLARQIAESLPAPRGEITASSVRRIMAALRLRKRHFPNVADAGWALVLVLYAARLEGHEIRLLISRIDVEDAWKCYL